MKKTLTSLWKSFKIFQKIIRPLYTFRVVPRFENMWNLWGGNSFIAEIDKNIKGTRKTYGVPNLAYVCGYECVLSENISLMSVEVCQYLC